MYKWEMQSLCIRKPLAMFRDSRNIRNYKMCKCASVQIRDAELVFQEDKV